MIILKDKNYKKLNSISYSDNPKKFPDIVSYTDIINKDKLEQIYKYIKRFKIDRQIFLTYDKIFINTSKKIDTKPIPNIFENIIQIINKHTGKLFNTCLITNHSQNINLDTLLPAKRLGYDYSISTLLINRDNTNSNLILLSKSHRYIREFNIPNGSLLSFRESVQKFWDIQLETNKHTELFSITFFRVYQTDQTKPSTKYIKKVKKLPYSLSKIYLQYRMRNGLRNKIRNGLIKAHSIAEGSQCILNNRIDSLTKFIKLDKLMGKGDWGNVFSSHLSNDTKGNRPFALKMSRIKEEDLNNPYTETSSSWYEMWILKDIIKPLILSNSCPNLPLYFDTFLCNKCDLSLRKADETHPCIITITELSSGDLYKLFKYDYLSKDELYSALFQIMAGVHAIHMSGQILNNDIKASNILYYKVTPGGYWHYKIDNKDFYVPNYGKLFIVNDYGVSTLYNPYFQLYPNKNKDTFNLGSRYAINIEEKFYPIEADIEYNNNKFRNAYTIKWLDNNGKITTESKGVNYRLNRLTGQVLQSNTQLSHKQKNFLFNKGINTNSKTWNFFNYPYYIPPFEFYNDVQDVLRMFVGGKRTTQKGNHCLYPSISKSFIKNVKPYLGKSENSRVREFSMETYHVLAGSFIKKFFVEKVDYTIKPKGKQISFFDMNKCKLYDTQS